PWDHCERRPHREVARPRQTPRGAGRIAALTPSPSSEVPRMSSSPGTVPVSPCPTGAELSAFALGTVSTADQERIAAHLDRCAACLAALEAMSLTHDSVVGGLQVLLPGGLFSPPPTGDASTVDDLSPGRSAAAPEGPAAGNTAFPRPFGDYELL